MSKSGNCSTWLSEDEDVWGIRTLHPRSSRDYTRDTTTVRPLIAVATSVVLTLIRCAACECAIA